MARFNPVAFLDSQGIEYKTRGDNVYFTCPLCGDTDLGGDNFGVRLDGSAWGCWRDRSHNGSLTQLICRLTGWRYEQALAFLEGSSTTTPISALRERHRKLLHPEEEPVAEPVELLPEFLTPSHRGPTRRFWQYFLNRGFTDVDELIGAFGILCARTGQFHDRLILPVRDDQKKLMGWTARAIGDAQVRYLAHPGSVKDAVFGGDVEPFGTAALVVVEGPFDALKLAHAANVYQVPVWVVSLMGTYATPSQAEQLTRLAFQCGRTAIVLDRAARGPARRLRKALPVYARVHPLPKPWKDPGDMSMSAAAEFLRGVVEA